MADQETTKFAIYRKGDAKGYSENNVLRMDGMTPDIAEGLAYYTRPENEASGEQVTLLYGAPGFSLSRVWFKSGYPLPLHSHSSDCLYFILAGSLRLGTEELSAGDGFFVGTDVPYTYTAGPDGVEVLEFRDTNELNIQFMARGKTFWEKAAKQLTARGSAWKDERPPSTVTAAAS